MDWLHELGPYILVALAGIVGWWIRTRAEGLRAIEEKLREDQRNVYRKLIDPYIKALGGLKGIGLNQALQEIKSHEYRKTVFDLILLGSDEVIQSYNKILKYTYETDDTEQKDPTEISRLWGNLFLEIRKSLGHKKTKLKEKDMLQAFIKDIDKYL